MKRIPIRVLSVLLLLLLLPALLCACAEDSLPGGFRFGMTREEALLLQSESPFFSGEAGLGFRYDGWGEVTCGSGASFVTLLFADGRLILVEQWQLCMDESDASARLEELRARYGSEEALEPAEAEALLASLGNSTAVSEACCWRSPSGLQAVFFHDTENVWLWYPDPGFDLSLLYGTCFSGFLCSPDFLIFLRASARGRGAS